MVGLLAVLAAAGGCGKKDAQQVAPEPAAPEEPAAAEKKAAPADDLRERARAQFGTLPAQADADGKPITAPRVALGAALYHDVRLSKNQDVSCASCHSLAAFGADPRQEAKDKGGSPGHRNQFGDRNSPTVLNAALHFRQFWDGRAADVEEQAKGPVLNPIEMAMASEAAVVAVLESIPGYAPMFKAAFPGADKPITYDHMAAAIGAFERKLLTPSPFDAWLGGDDAALSADAKAGLGLFMEKGCTTCHTGVALGGGMYQKLGLIKPYDTKDPGRAAVTKNDGDKHFFKVPSLRNVAETGPWLHDGSIKTLPEMINIMLEHQLPSGETTDAQKGQLLAFLKSLTGKIPADLATPPEPLPSGPKTPKPDPS